MCDRSLTESAGVLLVNQPDLHRPLLATRTLLEEATNDELMYELHQRGFQLILKKPTATIKSESSSLSAVGGEEELQVQDLYLSRLQSKIHQPHFFWAKATIWSRRLFSIAMTALILWRSVPVVKNLLSPNQVMNTSYDPFRITNAYGKHCSTTTITAILAY